MAIITTIISEGSEGTVSITINDSSKRWTSLTVIASQKAFISINAPALSKSLSRVCDVGTTVISWSVSIPLTSEVNWKGNTVLVPSVAVDIGTAPGVGIAQAPGAVTL